jgi:EAL domain-containing protein (putative c-di-GMP-specific phosphodiesterase class I)
MQAAWRLVADFREPFLVHGSELFATASIGVTVCSTAMQADDALREADTAMFVAKNQGRDQVTLFSEDLRTVVTSRLHLEGELRHALERNQLVVWYQPEVDLATGAITAVEALLRWRRNDGEVLSADCFIDVAEETGLILDFGDWVLKEVCKQAAYWGQADPGRALTVRVNVSALQLAEGGLIDALDVALADSGLDPTLLCIEITETALLRETSTVRDNLAKIRRRGIRIALDDFGTGYASLAYIRQYPVDVLKIDRSFVTNITSSQHDQQLLRGIVALADALAITVTAEGVENVAQAEALSALGCPRAQGFLYSAAVPPDQITDLLKRPSPAHSALSESTRRAAPAAADPAGPVTGTEA